MSDAVAGEEALEVPNLLEAVFQRYGWDFRGYARASVNRRIRSRLTPESVASVSELRDKVLEDPEAMERLLLALTVHVTSLFRDPTFYRSFREKAVPWLKTYPFIRIWHAGCSTGEEVYSMAILLEEEGLAERSRIYATDLSDSALGRAREGVYPLSSMKEYTTHYIEAGGKRDFSEYYTARYERAIFRASLRDQVVFAAHNLVTDSTFNEFQAILCRNVMIYFDAVLQERVQRLLHASLCSLGVLGLGRKESLRFSPFEADYEPLDDRERLYRRVR
jgi:chemotaxis protein methyltransferase CheR